MKIEKIKIKDWIENHRHGSVAIGQKIIISTYDKQPLSLLELESIKEFIKKLRS